jgi:hypothetical protein
MQGQHPDLLRLRSMAAAAILLAGLTLGFILGRMSVWLVGFDPPNAARTAHETAKQRPTAPPPAPVVRAAPEPAPTATLPAGGPQANAGSPRAPAANPSTPAAVPQPGPPTPPDALAAAAAATPSQEPPKPVVAPNWRAASGDRTPAAAVNDEEGSAAPSVKVINPSSGDRRAAAEPVSNSDRNDSEGADTESDRPGIAACERRYSSFRRSDGTYQPYGGGSRQRCPLLR